jgi:hypothetical protein
MDPFSTADLPISTADFSSICRPAVLANPECHDITLHIFAVPESFLKNVIAFFKRPSLYQPAVG